MEKKESNDNAESNNKVMVNNEQRSNHNQNRRMSTDVRSTHINRRNSNVQIKNIEKLLDEKSKEIFKELCDENGNL